MNNQDVKSVLWENNKLYILDQTKLPVDIEIEEQTSVEQVWESIKKIKSSWSPRYWCCGCIWTSNRNAGLHKCFRRDFS